MPTNQDLNLGSEILLRRIMIALYIARDSNMLGRVAMSSL